MSSRKRLVVWMFSCCFPSRAQPSHWLQSFYDSCTSRLPRGVTSLSTGVTGEDMMKNFSPGLNQIKMTDLYCHTRVNLHIRQNKESANHCLNSPVRCNNIGYDAGVLPRAEPVKNCYITKTARSVWISLKKK